MNDPSGRRQWLTAGSFLAVCVVLVRLEPLPFGSPTFAAVVVLAGACAVAEVAGTYFRHRTEQWSWAASTSVAIPVYATDPGWWVVLVTPVLMVSYLARHYSTSHAAVRTITRGGSTFAGAWVALIVLEAPATGTGFGAMAAAALSGAVVRSGGNAAANHLLDVRDPDEVRLVGRTRDNLVSEVLLAYLSLSCVWAYHLDDTLALIIVVPAVIGVALALFLVDRMALRLRLFEAVAAGQAMSRRSPLDMAWSIGHAVDRAAGEDATVHIAVCGSRSKYYEIVNGVPRLRSRGVEVWEQEWVQTARRSSLPLTTRKTPGGDFEYLFRLSDGPENAVLYRIATAPKSPMRRRLPVSTVREFVAVARQWAEPAMRAHSDVFSAASETSNHLLSLLSQPGPDTPVREILVELRRLEELVAASLGGVTSGNVPEARDRSSRVPVGVWVDE